MKLLDKIKDLFTDEVTDDEEFELEETEKEEKNVLFPKNELPKVMRDTIKKEEKSESKHESKSLEDDDDVDSESKVLNKKFNFPIDIDMQEDLPSRKNKNVISDKLNDSYNLLNEERKLEKRNNAVNSVRNNNVNVLSLEKETTKKVSELYSKKSEDKNIKPKFKASPVISPVYGVLDKNYTKEEVKEKTDDNSTMKRPSKKVDFETVRKKAFGNLVDDIKENMLCENCELYKEVKKINSLSKDDLLYEMTVDDANNGEVTIEKAYGDYEEFGVAYEPKVEKRKVEVDDNSDNFDIDSTSKISKVDEVNESFSSIRSKVDIDEYKDSSIEKDSVDDELPSRTSKKKDTKVDEDFFELIDSMYKERTDD